jgi:hypothetical protein
VSTTARFLAVPTPELGEGSQRFEIDCRHSRTRLWWTPGKLVLPERHVVSVLLQRHEDECGRCRLDRLWERHGDVQLRQMVDELYDQVQQRMVARHLAGRRN